MLERWPLPTLVLATVTAWTVLLALAAALGMGGRIAPHPADPALAPPLPEIAAPRAEIASRPLSEFTAVIERPLFSPDRRPQVVQLGGAEVEASAGELELTSVILTPELRMALFRDTDSGQTLRAREGAPIEGRPGWRVLELEPRSVVVDGPQGTSTLLLRTFDGRGGEAPTPLREAPRAVAAPAVSSPVQTQTAETDDEPSPPNLINARERAEQIRQRIEARRAELREQAARRQEAQED